MLPQPHLLARAQAYAARHQLELREQLGRGVHGIVLVAQSQVKRGRSAVKIHEHADAYHRERDVYLRLQEHNVKTLRGCRVPKLLDFDDELWVIRMTVVKRPFVLDFAGAFLDRPPDFGEDVVADWHAEKQVQFGPRWPEVQAILGVLEGYGIFLVDVNPGNISFGD
jgi:hypothetical protein